MFAKLQHRPARQTALPSSSFSALTRLPQHFNLQPANIPTWLDSKSFRLNSFADPHPLTPVASILYKNSGGQGVSRALPSLFRISHLPYALPSSVSRNSFVCHSYENTGGCGYSSHSGKHCSVAASNSFHSSAFFSYSCALFCAFLHFLALAQNSTLLFSIDSALFAKKNTRGACPSPANTLVVREGFPPQNCQLRAVDCQLIQEEGGDGDRSQGCTGPRGRTLREDQARPVSQSGVTSE